MDMPLIIDIILAAIFAACVYSGAKNGFVRAVASLIASVVALCATMFMVLNFGPVISEKYVNPWIETKLEQQLEENMDESDLETVDSLISTAKKVLTAVGDMLGSEEEDADSADKTEVKKEEKTEEEADTAKELVGSISETVGSLSTTILMFLILFALFYAVLRVLIDQLRFINHIPIVGPLNILLGMALGAVTGAILLAVPIWVIVNVVPSVFDISSVVDPALLEKSKVIALILKYLP